MAIVEARVGLWEALAGRAPGTPLSPADPDLYTSILERLNPARARPVLRGRVEEAPLTTLRGQPYVMLRSPDREASYARLAPEEVELAHLMDGSRTVASLVGAFARITGRLAPEQVMRVVADLGGNRMLEELPTDAFRPLEELRRRPLPARIGHALIAAAKGQRMVLLDPDRIFHWAYRLGGFLLFTRVAAVLMVAVAIAGLAIFVRTWIGGAQSAFVTGNSYALGGLTLLGLNVLCLIAHELGHGMAAKHAGRRVPAAGFLLYFGIPSFFVDTTDVWMSNRRHRLLTTAAGPSAALVFAGVANVVGVFVPEIGWLAFKLSFGCYLNCLFNFNPLMALDGYYLLMDWLELPNLRPRAVVLTLSRARRFRFGWRGLAGEERLIAMYGVASALWLVVMASWSVRMYKDRLSGLFAGLWRGGWAPRVGLIAFIVLLASPLVHAALRSVARRRRSVRERLRERRRDADEPRRLDALRRSRLGQLDPGLLSRLAAASVWRRPRHGAPVVEAGASVSDVMVVVEGVLEARRPDDPAGTVRRRAITGDVVGAAPVLSGQASSLTWTATGTRLLLIPAGVFAAAAGSAIGGMPPEAEEAQSVLTLPVFGSMSEDDRLATLGRMHSIDLEPGQPIAGSSPEWAAVVSSGVMWTEDRRELRRGDLLGPADDGVPIRALARTRARLWAVPALSGLSLLLGSGTPLASGGSRSVGAHGDGGGYPPLGGPPGGEDNGADERLGRSFRRVIVLLLIVAGLAVWLAVPAGRGWTEAPTDRVLFTVQRGPVDAVIDQHRYRLDEGERLFIRQGDWVWVRDRGLASLTFRGGADLLLCPDTRVGVGPLRHTGDDPVRPAAKVAMTRGRVIADTSPTVPAFLSLMLEIVQPLHTIASREDARYAVGPGVQVRTGDVWLDEVPVPSQRRELTCGGGDAAAVVRVPHRPPVQVAEASDQPPPREVQTVRRPVSGSWQPAEEPTVAETPPRPTRSSIQNHDDDESDDDSEDRRAGEPRRGEAPEEEEDPPTVGADDPAPPNPNDIPPP